MAMQQQPLVSANVHEKDFTCHTRTHLQRLRCCTKDGHVHRDVAPLSYGPQRGRHILGVAQALHMRQQARTSTQGVQVPCKAMVSR